MVIPDSETAKRAYEAHPEEYQAIRDEITLHIGHENQLIGYAIAVITASGAIFAVGQPSLAEMQPLLFLVASLLTSAISWAFLEASLNIIELGRYVRYTLAPKIQSLVGDETMAAYQVMKWEEVNVPRSARRRYLHGLAMTGKASIPWIASIFYIVAFCHYKALSAAPWSGFEKILLGLALVVTLPLPIGGLMNASAKVGITFRPFRLRGRRRA